MERQKSGFRLGQRLLESSAKRQSLGRWSLGQKTPRLGLRKRSLEKTIDKWVLPPQY